MSILLKMELNIFFKLTLNCKKCYNKKKKIVHFTFTPKIILLQNYTEITSKCSDIAKTIFSVKLH